MPKVDISLLEIVNYCENRTRPLQEGEAVFKAGHIIFCGLNNKNNINSLCLQSSALTSSPHEIQIMLGDEPKKWVCKCTCKAGQSGYCKHVVATLIYINRYEELEFISCTDVTQKWGKERKGVEDIYRGKRVKDFCHPEIKKKYKYDSTEEITRRNFNLLVACKDNSAIARLYQRAEEGETAISGKVQKSSNHQLDSILNNIKQSQFLESLKLSLHDLEQCCREVTNSFAKCNIKTVAVESVQGSEQWKKERQLRITGSRCYSIYTYQNTQNWENKAIKYFWPKAFVSKFTEHGKKYEKEAIGIFQNDTQYQIVHLGLLISEMYPWLAYSPDGIVFQDDVPVALLEVKCPYTGKENSSDTFKTSCNYLEEVNGEVILKKRHQYYAQVQFGMGLLNLPCTHLIIYASCTKTYLHIKIKFDAEYAEELIKTVTDKYFTNMLHHYCVNKDEMENKN